MAAENCPVRFGIIGCSRLAKKVTRAILLSPATTLHAISSASPEEAKQFAVANELPETVRICSSHEEVVDDPDVDAVFVPVPVGQHSRWGVAVAEKKKHLLMEKPGAVDLGELDKVLEACERNGVQFMDATMWLHHPRTGKMKELISDPKLVGNIGLIHTTSTAFIPRQFFETAVPAGKPAMETMGAVGELGWYGIGAVLWAKDFHLPSSVTALPDITKSSTGVILSCSAQLHYEQDNTVGIIHCSFLSHLTMELEIVGVNGSLYLGDFILPYKEQSAEFNFTWMAKFVERDLGWNVKPEKVEVVNEVSQEVLMVEEFARLVQGIKAGSPPDVKWAEICRKTQLVLDSVMKSIEIGCTCVTL
ncbi:unnamed protein product [Linum trigynum]|uniref:Gfo/Idh/MocA-like oxidoreductase N-terminal domain-containing protein n=1 Tax=Linum trigynum TaxID=586398 RepID=A0AAV2G7E4_9ROSI